MKACLFIIPGSTPEATSCRGNLFQVWNGNLTLEAIQNLDNNDESLCSWAEIKAMFASGLVNAYQSALIAVAAVLPI